MKKLGILFGVVLLFFAMGCQTTKTEETTNLTGLSILENENLIGSYLEWVGRTAYQNQKQYFYHTATGLKVRFYGRSLAIDLSLEDKKNDIYYSVAKDGEDLLEASVFIQKDEFSQIIVEFDTFDVHVVEIVKRSEPEDGVTSISKISTNGYFLPSIPTIQLHFLIIGASGISGHGALGNSPQSRSTANSSFLHSFGYLTARAFGGSVEFVASSGWGLLYGYNDPTGQINITKAYEVVGILPNRQLVPITYTANRQPDYIIINIGGNDYTSVINNSTGFDRTNKIQAFKNAVGEFIMTLREDAPNAHIIWTMTTGSLNGTAALDVINSLSEQDKRHVHMAVIKQVGEDGDPVGANNHASYITHQKSAAILIELIQSLPE